MSYAQVLSAVGLIRTSRRRGFCPACRLFQTGDGPQEIAAPALVVLGCLALAALAWVVTIAQSPAMDDMRMSMGPGPAGPFLVAWTVMMVAMMLPSATPLVFEFARTAEGRRGWPGATALLGLTYLGVWLVFGGLCYVVYTAVGMPWPNQALVGGAALVVAGLYALTPAKRASEARCRELCALHGALPFNLLRSAVVVGARYGLSCLGCTAGLMVAVLLIGMANVGLMIVLTALVLAYKLAPVQTGPWRVALAAGLIALGVLYAVAA